MIFDRRARVFLAITALLMASAIAFGAFGAHGLKNILTAEMLKVFHTFNISAVKIFFNP